jgi:hypothetical protein
MTTTWVPPTQINKIGELVTSEEWAKMTPPEETNLASFGGSTTTKDGFKLVWVKRVDLENFLINYRGTTTRAAYISSNVEGVTHQVEILIEGEDTQAFNDMISQV